MDRVEYVQDDRHCLCDSDNYDESLYDFYIPDYTGRPDAPESTEWPPLETEEYPNSCFATELPSATPMESNDIFSTNHEDIATSDHGPSSPCVSFPTSLPIVCLEATSNFSAGWFTKQHVDAFFGGSVKKEKFEKMSALYNTFLMMRDAKIARFDVDGELNVFGFNLVHVLDRTNFDRCMDMLANDVLRKFNNGRQVKERKSCIYEIFKQCGMAVVRGKGNTSVQPGQKKSLKQDTYVFKRAAFENSKNRAIRGW